MASMAAHALACVRSGSREASNASHRGLASLSSFHARQKLQKALADCYQEQIGPVPESEAAPKATPDDVEKSEDES